MSDTRRKPPTARHRNETSTVIKHRALVLLGPTGSGKTPLGDWLEQNTLQGRPCHHFDFGANLRAAVTKPGGDGFTIAERRFFQTVLDHGALLEDEHFPLAARILRAFLARRRVSSADWLVLNGLPRHLQQACALDQYVTVKSVVLLDCDARTVSERLQRDSGGDRAQRNDDTAALVARKLALFEQRTRPLLDYYRAKGATIQKITVGVETQPAEMADQLGGQGRRL